jgi:mannose-1-phosphate guanylyltransferase / mannose-6-phosphate isomerase
MAKKEVLIENGLLRGRKIFEQRPWGNYRITLLRRVYNDGRGIMETHIQKVLTVKNKLQLSLQKHNFRREYWTIHAGRAIVTLGPSISELKETKHKAGDEIFIPQGFLHRLKNYDRKNNLIIIENAYGEYDENDIHRYDDDFGRQSKWNKK